MITRFAVAVLWTTLLAAGSYSVANERDGKKFWIKKNFPMSLCPTIEMNDKTSCQVMRSSSFVIEKTEKFSIFTRYFVRFDSSHTGYIQNFSPGMTEEDADHAEKMAAKSACDRKGGVHVGMTREQVYASCWGRPGRINKTISANGVHEQLVYSGDNYLYLENGILRSIQTHE